jgi:hypothetical protein
MPWHAEINTPSTAVENGADPYDNPLLRLDEADNLTHGPAGSGDVFYHQYPLVGGNGEPTPQGHHPAFAFSEDRPYAQGSSHLMANDKTPNSWRGDGINGLVVERGREPLAERLGVLRIL